MCTLLHTSGPNGTVCEGAKLNNVCYIKKSTRKCSTGVYFQHFTFESVVHELQQALKMPQNQAKKLVYFIREGGACLQSPVDTSVLSADVLALG